MNMENFKLKRVKLNEDLSIEIIYLEKLNKDGDAYWVEKTVKSPIQRHNDMDIVANRYKEHVARIYGILAVGLYKEPKDFNAQERRVFDDILNRVKIIAVTVSGEDDKEGVLISATLKVLKNKTIVMNTPNMMFRDESYQYSYELGAITDELKDETFAYLFKRKFAQLELAFESEPEAQSGEEVKE